MEAGIRTLGIVPAVPVVSTDVAAAVADSQVAVVVVEGAAQNSAAGVESGRRSLGPRMDQREAVRGRTVVVWAEGEGEGWAGEMALAVEGMVGLRGCKFGEAAHDGRATPTEAVAAEVGTLAHCGGSLNQRQHRGSVPRKEVVVEEAASQPVVVVM